MASEINPSRVTIKVLEQMKNKGEKISMLTAYDYSFAKIIDEAGIDIILVGDSASNVMAGHETTLPITLDQMVYHASSVIRAVKRALVVVDLPFGTYQSDSQEALKSAIRIMKESGAHAVKLEGGHLAKESIERIIQAGIPVMGHLGLTPQSIYKFGTYTVRAEREEEIKKEEEKQKKIDEEKEIALKQKAEEEQRIKQENQRIKEWEKKFDLEQKKKEEELIRKFYSDQSTNQSQNDSEIDNTSESDMDNKN